MVDTFFRLTFSVALWGGRDAANTTGVCSQCLSPTGPAPAHSTHCSGSTLPHREPSEAGPRLHAPPRSKPLRLSTQEALRGADLVGLGLRFVPFPGPSSPGVWRARSLRLWPFPVAQFSGSTAGVPSQADDNRPEPPEVLVSKEACLQFGR